MDSRTKILSVIKTNQPSGFALPELDAAAYSKDDLVKKFSNTLVAIGGAVFEIQTWNNVRDYVDQNYSGKRAVSTIAEVDIITGAFSFKQNPHLLESVDVAILQGEFAVAENGAIWIADKQMGDRVLPFITEHLILVVQKNKILPTLHEAYERIGHSDYDFGTFIAGPSKTADIEQSLVLGAHGAKSLTVLLISQ